MSCDSPTLIKNPYYRKNPKEGLNFLHDCRSQYIRVPCGRCPSCIATKQMYFVQRFFMESLNSFVFFSTFTYDNEHLPTLNKYGFKIRYANFKHFTDMVKRIRKNNLFTRPFRYFAVSELGSYNGRPHFHCIWCLPKYPDDDDKVTPYLLEKLLYDVLFKQWSINVGSNRSPIYESLFTFHQKVVHGKLFTNFDTHFVKPVIGSSKCDSVAFYVLKYLLKGSTRERKLQQALRLNLDYEQYKEVWYTVKSRSHFSKHFGYGFNLQDSSKPSKAVLDYIKRGIRLTPSGSPCPVFYSPYDGKSYPLSPYYQGNSLFYTFDDALPILMASTAPLTNDLPEDYYQKTKVHFQKFQKILRETDLHGNPLLFD